MQNKRNLLYLGILLAILAWIKIPRPWHPEHTLRTAHFSIESNASKEDTVKAGEMLELLRETYLQEFPGRVAEDEPLHKVRIYKDRDQFRSANPGMGWAEAVYKDGIAHGYFDATKAPFDTWGDFGYLIHEVVHQLNKETNNYRLAKWLEEGIACHFDNSTLENGKVKLGKIDGSSYPCWWLHTIANGNTMQESIDNGNAWPLRSVINQRFGPLFGHKVNLHYLHWWTMVKWIAETRPDILPELLNRGGGIDDFTNLVGKPEDVQEEWHTYVRRMKGNK